MNIIVQYFKFPVYEFISLTLLCHGHRLWVHVLARVLVVCMKVAIPGRFLV